MRRLAVAMLAIGLMSPPARAGTQEIQSTDSLPTHSIADASAPIVSESNLIESERFWPYQVALVSEQPRSDGRGTLPVGALGVLIRVEADARARVDFGRDGIVTTPVRATDLIARANEIRVGKISKAAPNLAYAIGPRLLDARADVPLRIPLAKTMASGGFLAVFIDPQTPSFTKLVTMLAPLADKDGVQAVLFPLGAYPDDKILPTLRKAGWKSAYLLDHLSESYTRTLIDGEIKGPELALYSAEGRTLWAGEFDGELSPELSLAWKLAFGR